MVEVVINSVLLDGKWEVWNLKGGKYLILM